MLTSAMAIQLLIGCGSPEPAPLPSRALAASEDTKTQAAETAPKAKKKTTADSVPAQPVEAPPPNPTALTPTQLATPTVDTAVGGAGALLGGITGANPLGGGSLLGGLGGIGALGGITSTASSLLSGVTGLLSGGGGLLGGLGGIGNLGALPGGLTGQSVANQ
jgi:hypothetical protein